MVSTQTLALSVIEVHMVSSGLLQVGFIFGTAEKGCPMTPDHCLCSWGGPMTVKFERELDYLSLSLCITLVSFINVYDEYFCHLIWLSTISLDVCLKQCIIEHNTPI